MGRAPPELDIRTALGKSGDDLALALNYVVKHKHTHLKEFSGFKLMGQRLNDVNTELLNNEMTYRLPLMVYYFLGILAAVIMLSACLNYTNLSTARALTRAKDIGVRKVAGASRRNLVLQFLSEIRNYGAVCHGDGRPAARYHKAGFPRALGQPVSEL